MYAAVRTILAGCADQPPFALQRPMVRRRADNVFVAAARRRLFYGPYGVCQATATECVTHPSVRNSAVCLGDRMVGEYTHPTIC